MKTKEIIAMMTFKVKSALHEHTGQSYRLLSIENSETAVDNHPDNLLHHCCHNDKREPFGNDPNHRVEQFNTLAYDVEDMV